MADKKNEYSLSSSYVVLVHGFCRRGGNMRYLARQLERCGYRTFSPTLPATFQNVCTCSEILADALDKRFPEGSVVHFVGHSMGGLIIRHYLSMHLVEGLGRVVLMGTPSGGTPQVSLLLKIIPFSRRIFKALSDLAEPGLSIAQPLNVPLPEIGIILGTKPDPLRKIFMQGEHDGLVQSKSARNLTVSDELTIPCIHERIHWRPDTAAAVGCFMETGKFLSKTEHFS
jgi:pimeloyl-ACP methyl ester carboxylesterase